MIRSVRCIYCGNKTRIVYKSVRSKYKLSTIILNRAPMHYCHCCNEVLISLEALAALRLLKSKPLKEGINEFDYDLISENSTRQEGAS